MPLVTYKGVSFDYTEPTKEMINIDDIFQSLPRLNRFVGHSSRAYSVAEHTFYCLLMAEKLNYTEREKILVFIHDFTEAYVGDCPAPLKRLIPDFSKIEEKVELAICNYIGIKPPTEEELLKVKRIDLTMLLIEMRDMTHHDWKKFIDHHTYEEFLKDNDFNLEHPLFSEATIREALKAIYKNLINKYLEGLNGNRD